MEKMTDLENVRLERLKKEEGALFAHPVLFEKKNDQLDNKRLIETQGSSCAIFQLNDMS